MEQASPSQGIKKQQPWRRFDKSAHLNPRKKRVVPKHTNTEPDLAYSSVERMPAFSFSYKPLKANEIRLLLLSAGAQTSPLEAKLVHATLTKSLEFEALSYVWGNPTSTRAIVLDSTNFQVTENLWSALWHIRENDNLKGVLTNRTIWIDAICINQKDINEKNQQVQRMSQIYNQASRVVAWLGPEGDDSDLGMKMLNLLDKLPDMDFWDEAHQYDPPWEILLEPSKREWTAVISLLNREYFTRVWIIQEVSLAKSLTIRCGLLDAGLQSVGWFADNYLQLSRLKQETEEAGEDYEINFPHTPLVCWAGDEISSSRAANFFHSSLERFGLSHNRFLELIQKFGEFRCTDPRDHIFALLDVAGDRKDVKIVADYSRPLQKVYQDVIRHWGFDRGGDLVSFSQDLQQSFRAPLEMDRELEKEVLSKGMDVGKRRPWFMISTWGGGFVSAFGTTLHKSHLISLELPTLVSANIDDVAPFAGLPKAVSMNDSRYGRAIIEASGESALGLDPQYIDGPQPAGLNGPISDQIQWVCPFLLNTGQIGLGPANMRDGDLIRRITSRRSMAVVLRRDSLGFYTIIGRAVALRVSAPTGRIWESILDELITGPGDDFFREGVCGISLPAVSIFIDILTLQEWTRWKDE